jgi:hypothetical protein
MVKLYQMCELAKALELHRNQVRGIILREQIKPVEYRPNIYGGVTGFYDIEKLKEFKR